jgi:1-acyl-sn-glycerol-3-phosphate acyltransferase
VKLLTVDHGAGETRLYRVLELTVAPVVRTIWRLDVRGAELVPSGPLVVVANHESLADPFFLGAGMARQLRFLTKEELFRGPFARVVRAAGGISVGRGRGDRGAVAAGVRALEQGAAVAVFPQGTVLGRADRPWLRGAARLALMTGAPLLPVCLVNTEKALRPVKVKIGFPSVKVLFGEPIAVEPGPATIAAAKALTEQVRLAVEALQAPFGPPDRSHMD